MIRSDLAYLEPFCSDEQLKKLEALSKYGTFRETAERLGINQRTLERSIATVKRKAAAQSSIPHKNYLESVPDPFFIKGISTNFDANGNVKQQWIKTQIDRGSYAAAIIECAKEFFDNPIKISVPDGPKDYQTDVIPWIQIGDGHIGMIAHRLEVNKNHDCDIAEQQLCKAFSMLVDQSPYSERCVINDLGDFTHYENYSGVTEASGHILDYDTRYYKMIRASVRIFRFMVDYALSKFQNVDIICNQGNHSRTNDIWMAELLKSAYGHTGRVNVLNNENVFIPYRMGNTFVMIHHSDKCKPNHLAHVMSTDYAKHWGEAKFRYIDIGHIHHGMQLKEHPGVRIESFNTLAPKDKYAHDHGYRARQSITIIDRSKKYGEISRRTLPIEMVEDAIMEEKQESVKTYDNVYEV
jgi:hypothetical protein